MNYDIVPRPEAPLAGRPRRVAREIATVKDYAIWKASAIRAKGYVAKVALIEVANLSSVQDLLVRQSPQAELRLTAIGDAAAAMIAAEILRMG